jgi:hypothetical protein
MFKFCIAFILACGVFATANAADKNSTETTATMQPPKPLENKVFDAMVGTWQGKSNMNGKEMQELVKMHWALNHQFLVMEVKATGIDDPKMKYEGMGMFGIDAQGKAKTYWFDGWGVDHVSTGSGVFSDNKLDLTDGNANFKETRSFEINGRKMVMHAKGTMTWQGKETSFDQTTVYKKQ